MPENVFVMYELREQIHRQAGETYKTCAIDGKGRHRNKDLGDFIYHTSLETFNIALLMGKSTNK